ncbi:MAG: FIST N-terminal domain-containing protein [Nitrospiraceae bacterium]
MLIETYSFPASAAQPNALRTAIPDSPHTLILLFGPSDALDAPERVSTLLSSYPHALALGCSTAGEILGQRISDRTYSVGIIHFERSQLRITSACVTDASASYRAGEQIAANLAAPDLRLVLVLSDGLVVNGSALVAGLNAGLPPSVVVSGGLAADGDRFQRTWVLKDRRPVQQHVTAVGIYGAALRVGHGSKGGWDNFGPERRVTKSRDNVLYELDDKPALQLYKEYLGERAAGLPATGLLFPLALRESSGHTKQVVRTILAVDESAQSLTFAGNIPEGHLAQLMRANFDRLITGAADAALAAKTSHATPVGPILTLAISCVGRRLILGERAEEEIEATQSALPADTSQIGFYSYGEISPFTTGQCHLHNQTMTLTTIGEA